MTNLVDRNTGDLVSSADQNLLVDYIQDGTHAINTLSLSIGGTSVIGTVGEYAVTVANNENVHAVSVIQNDTSNNPLGIGIQNAGSGNALFINQDGDGIALNIDTEATSAANYGLKIDSPAAPAALFQHNIYNYVVLGCPQNIFGASNFIYRNEGPDYTDGSVLKIDNANASDNQPAFEIVQAGSTEALKITAATGSSAHMKLVPQASPPASPAEGQIYANTDHDVYYYTGSAWASMTQSGGAVTSRADVVNYDDFVANEYTLFALPAGATLLSCHMSVGTLFDTASATVEVGISTDHDKFITSQNVHTTGIKNENYTLGSFLLSTSGTTDIVAYLTASGGGSWLSGGNLSTARYHCRGFGGNSDGTVTGGNPAINSTEEYNGASWSAGGNLAYGRRCHGTAGTQTAGLTFGGYISSETNLTEEYNGTSWSSGGNLGSATDSTMGAGTQTAGLKWGGEQAMTTTEEYDGNTWSGSGAVPSPGIRAAANFGIQTAAVSAGGCNDSSKTAITYEYNGTAWSTGNNISVATEFSGGAGVLTDGIRFGGNDGSITGTSEIYDGTNWSAAGSNLNTARNYLAGNFGTGAGEGLAIGGTTGSDSAVTEEYTISSSLTQGVLTIRTAYTTYG